MSQYITGRFYAMTDIGMVREANEDTAITAINPFGEIILIVADGMGGRNKGDYASKFLADFIIKNFKEINKKLKNPKNIEKWLYKIINTANQQLFAKSTDEEAFKGMGSTLSLAYISGDNYVVAQVGDSRVYEVSDKKLRQVSVDQSYVQYLANSKKISQENTKTHPERHKITNAIGIRNVCNVDFVTVPYVGQTLMLCSDGVYNNVSDLEIASVLKSDDSPEQKCKQLVAFGNANGGSDNMAVIVWEM